MLKKMLRDSRDRFEIPMIALIVTGFMVSILMTGGFQQRFSGGGYEFFLLGLIWYYWGGCGLIIFIKRELPQGFFSIKGKVAMMYGLLMMLFAWAFSMMCYWLGFKMMIADIYLLSKGFG